MWQEWLPWVGRHGCPTLRPVWIPFRNVARLAQSPDRLAVRKNFREKWCWSSLEIFWMLILLKAACQRPPATSQYQEWDSARMRTSLSYPNSIIMMARCKARWSMLGQIGLMICVKASTFKLTKSQMIKKLIRGKIITWVWKTDAIRNESARVLWMVNPYQNSSFYLQGQTSKFKSEIATCLDQVRARWSLMKKFGRRGETSLQASSDLFHHPKKTIDGYTVRYLLIKQFIVILCWLQPYWLKV